jgi:hypothetical protein
LFQFTKVTAVPEEFGIAIGVSGKSWPILHWEWGL